MENLEMKRHDEQFPGSAVHLASEHEADADAASPTRRWLDSDKSAWSRRLWRAAPAPVVVSRWGTTRRD